MCACTLFKRDRRNGKELQEIHVLNVVGEGRRGAPVQSWNALLVGKGSIDIIYWKLNGNNLLEYLRVFEPIISSLGRRGSCSYPRLPNALCRVLKGAR